MPRFNPRHLVTDPLVAALTAPVGPDADKVVCLLNSGASVHATDRLGRSIMQIAIEDGCHVSVQKVLIEAEADVPSDAPVMAMRRPKHATLTEGYQLFVAGASLTAKDDRRRTPYQIAIEREFSKLILNMLRYRDVSKALVESLKQPESVKADEIHEVVALGERFATVDDQGRNALEIALDVRHPTDIIKALLKGVDSNPRLRTSVLRAHVELDDREKEEAERKRREDEASERYQRELERQRKIERQKQEEQEHRRRQDQQSQELRKPQKPRKRQGELVRESFKLKRRLRRLGDYLARDIRRAEDSENRLRPKRHSLHVRENRNKWWHNPEVNDQKSRALQPISNDQKARARSMNETDEFKCYYSILGVQPLVPRDDIELAYSRMKARLSIPRDAVIDEGSGDYQRMLKLESVETAFRELSGFNRAEYDELHNAKCRYHGQGIYVG